MIIIDAGPIVALLDSQDRDYLACSEFSRTNQDLNIVTTWPCFTEAMYLLYRSGGLRFQDAAWALINRQVIRILELSDDNVANMQKLMSKYADSPMDLADASLVALGESLRIRQVFTLDKHFHAYRFSDGTSLDVIP